MSDKAVRTRFAPSPTGPLHIGGVRTALFGWLHARHHGGQFILRIEDTDRSRYVEGSLEMIYAGLRWTGIEWDEGPDKGGPYGPYIQSERLEHYQTWANWLVEKGHAYKCFCTSERLAAVNEAKKQRGEPPGYDRHCRTLTPDDVAQREANGQSYVIRFKMPITGETIAEDLIRGKVHFENNKIQDAVLLKSDGFPTYHLAHIVDDYLMEISHVTRAIEWLPSYPLHVQIWRAFGWETPVFAHLPVLLNPSGKGKLSKRSTAFTEDGRVVPVMAREFSEQGYLPEAVRNFLTNIGWNFGQDREIFTTDEAIARFSLADVNEANSAYPIEKLEWLNGHYIREMALDDLAERLRGPLEEAGYTVDQERLRAVAPLVQTRIKTLKDVVDLAGFFFADWSAFQAPPAEWLIQKKMDAEGTIRCLEAGAKRLSELESLAHEVQYEAMKELAKELGVKNGQLFGALRVAVTGQKVSTPTFESIEILGREEALRRINLALETLKQTA